MLSWKFGFGRLCVPASMASLLLLTGCGKFFPPLTSGGGSGSSSGDYLYIGNLTNYGTGGTTTYHVAGFTIASSAVSSSSGAPYSVPLAPTALAVTPANSYLYVGSESGDIYVYPIGSGGDLGSGTLVSSSFAPTAMRVTPNGDYLIAAGIGQVYIFSIGSGGALNAVGSYITLPNVTQPAADVEITPNGEYVFVSCATAGVFGLSLNSSTGSLALISSSGFNPKASGSDYGMAITPNSGFLFAAETGTGGVREFSISSTTGALAEVTGSPYTTGTGARAVTVDSTGSYVYVANFGADTISGFTLTNSGSLTAMSPATVTTGDDPVAMVEDSSHTYLAVICSGGSPDLQLFTLSSTTGALSSFTTEATGADPALASSLAATYATSD